MVIGKAAQERAGRKAEAEWRDALTKIEIIPKQKLTDLGFRLSLDLKEHVVVRDTENWDIIRDGAELCFVGDVDIRGEKMQSIVRLLRTLPRPLTLHFDESNAKTKSAKKSAAMGKKVKIAAAENSSSDDDVLSEDDGETI
jgi:hypothetical protein